MPELTAENFMRKGSTHFFDVLPDPSVAQVATGGLPEWHAARKIAFGPVFGHRGVPETPSATWAAVSNFSPTAFAIPPVDLTNVTLRWVTDVGFGPRPDALAVTSSEALAGYSYPSSVIDDRRIGVTTSPTSYPFEETEIQEPRWYRTVESRLLHLLSLPADWDAEGADPVAPDAAEQVLALLWSLLGIDDRSPEIVPDPDGGLQLEWHTNSRDLEIQVEARGAMHLWSRDAVHDEELEFDFTIGSRSFSHVSGVYETLTSELRRSA